VGARFESKWGGAKLVCALNLWYCSLGEDFSIGKNNRIKILLSSQKKRWDQTKKVSRTPFLVSHILKITKTAPQGAKKRHWIAYVCIAWIFLLRHGEISKLKPRDVSCYFDKNNNKIWRCIVREAKTQSGRNEVQSSRFEEDDIPAIFLKHLTWFSNKSDNFEWKTGSHPQHVAHIKNHLKLDCSHDQDFAFHCTRHGRATYLSTIGRFDLRQLMAVGRWRTKTAAYLYIHG